MIALIPSSGRRLKDTPSAASLFLKVYVDLPKYNQRLMRLADTFALIGAQALI
ncbi:hypothetical protein [Microbulbifer sp. A4B17]|uniref:hypothetical protein n=1 Tax=Microbulbifer sp. A4B17 TaxID=359370 RepID=UPI0013004EA0|nr:hypothetical protein [Microbulbifer sp. A4B17]